MVQYERRQEEAMTGETASPWVSRRSASSRTPVTLLTSETNALCYTPGLKKTEWGVIGSKRGDFVEDQVLIAQNGRNSRWRVRGE